MTFFHMSVYAYKVGIREWKEENTHKGPECIKISTMRVQLSSHHFLIQGPFTGEES